MEQHPAVLDVRVETWVAKRKAFGSEISPAFDSKWYGLRINTKARQPRYIM